MTHFRGQIRGPHWGPTMDNMLIEFWRRHDCLFNSSLDSYYDKDLKTELWTEFAASVGKPVSDVERRSRSLRTQYGRVLWHPERVSTAQQKMLWEKLDFLRPFIVRRRADSYLEDKYDDRDEEDEELETKGSIDQEMGSSFGSPLDADVTPDPDPDDEPRPASVLNPAPLHCPKVTEVMSVSCPYGHDDEAPATRPDQTNAPNHDILDRFAEVMLADMRQIRDHMVLMRLRRDITDLVFKAAEEDAQRRCVQAPSVHVQLHAGSASRRPSLQTSESWRPRLVRRMKRARRASLQPVQRGAAPEGTSEQGAQLIIQAAEIKRETEPVKIEEETLP